MLRLQPLLFSLVFSLILSLLFIPAGQDGNEITSVEQTHVDLTWLPIHQKCPVLSRTLVLWPRLCSQKLELFTYLPEHFILQTCGHPLQSLTGSPPNFLLSLASSCF